MADETNPSSSDIERAEKYLNAVSLDTSDLSSGSLGSSNLTSSINDRLKGVTRGAEPRPTQRPSVIFKDINGQKLGKDLRVKIRVPANYLTGITQNLSGLGGVIFPYTPSINYEYKADYAAQTPVHSNFAINFYQRSSISSISIAGKFTVSNNYDAGMYLASLHLLRSLTRMRSGGATGGDSDSGAPPPVCRLDAYGEFMLENVPVVITSVRIDLPDNVDYFTSLDPTYNGPDGPYSMSSIPTVSTIAINCLPMYSRNEMQKFSVTQYLESSDFRNQGYL
jgi:hypothetical protein